MSRFEADSTEFWTWLRDRRAKLIAFIEGTRQAGLKITASHEELRRLKAGLASVERLLARRAPAPT